MAFDRTKLSNISQGSADGFKMWVYTSADAIATVNTSGYFNEAAENLSVRDVIISIDTSTPTTSFISVLSNTGTVVDVSDGLAITETDTD